MKFSIVTISYNQAQFLEQAIRSVIEQDYPNIEYIVVDPGSTDGSRQIIERYSDRINKIIFEPDRGPADGLNKGFSHATGDIFGFINSDDYLLPSAIKHAASAFMSSPDKDILSGHSIVVDDDGNKKNVFSSRKFSLARYVYGASVIAQQSTFFRRVSFFRAGMFNVDNRLTWDGELWVDMAISGASFGRIPKFLSAFRIHDKGITGSGLHKTLEFQHVQDRIFAKVKGRSKKPSDELIRIMYKLVEYGLHPSVAVARLVWGPVI